jgi:hypothetical protein
MAHLHSPMARQVMALSILYLNDTQNRLNERREWELHQDVHFTFAGAEFAEI